MIPVKNSLNELNSGVEALASICNGFFGRDVASVGSHSVQPHELPAPYQELLVHHEHMTATLTAYYGASIELRVLQEQLDQEVYTRAILLVEQGSNAVVEFGIAKMNLALIPSNVRAEIREGRTPLGDILVTHDVFRRVDPKWYFRFDGQSPLMGHFGSVGNATAFGRVGIIHLHNQPAIQLLEVVVDARRGDPE